MVVSRSRGGLHRADVATQVLAGDVLQIDGEGVREFSGHAHQVLDMARREPLPALRLHKPRAGIGHGDVRKAAIPVLGEISARLQDRVPTKNIDGGGERPAGDVDGDPSRLQCGGCSDVKLTISTTEFQRLHVPLGESVDAALCGALGLGQVGKVFPLPAAGGQIGEGEERLPPVFAEVNFDRGVSFFDDERKGFGDLWFHGVPFGSP